MLTWSVVCTYRHRYNFFPLITGLGLVFTPLTDQSQASFTQSFFLTLYKIALSHSRSVIFQNPDDLEFFTQHSIPPSSAQCYVVNGSGVNLTDYPVVPLPTIQSFLFLGRLLREKGLLEFIAAAKLVKRQYPAVIFRIAGMHDHKSSSITSDELTTLLSDNSVEYLGELADVTPALAKCQVFVLPSYREGVPRSTLEALSTGRPIITTDVPGCRETVQPGFNGLVVPPRNVSALANAFICMIQTPIQDLQNMAHNSRSLAENRFDSHIVNLKMLSILLK